MSHAVHGDLIVISRRPGIIRGGVSHPPHATHAADTFSREQLGEIIDEPELTVVIGEVLTALPEEAPTETEGKATAKKGGKTA